MQTKGYTKMLKREELVVGQMYTHNMGKADNSNAERLLLAIGEHSVFYRNEHGEERTAPIEAALQVWEKPRPRVKGWVNVYHNYASKMRPSKERADAFADPARLACIYIDVEEGEGL